MMKKITSLFLLFVVAICALAAPISRNQALEIARSYLVRGHALLQAQPQADLSLAYECVSRSSRDAHAGHPLYYVFNKGQNGGFVIVSGDDRIKPVLGVVPQGAFSRDNVNDNMQWWLQALEGTILSVVESSNEEKREVLKHDARVKPFVEPLVQVQWGQGEPYNENCPKDDHHGETLNSLTGCVAVSMAQVLNYWQYPNNAVGFVNYITDTHQMQLFKNLSSYPFHWDKMLPSYQGVEATAEEIKAVADLMYVCGLSVKMDYCSQGSGAYLDGITLKKYFGMAQSTRLVARIYYTRAQWDALVRAELSEGRPLIYSARTATAGHSFVCDGYSEDGLFHINWGWNGWMDGYFALAELNSSSEVAGAPSGSDDSYSFDQAVIIGLQPETESSEAPVHTLYFNNIKPYKATDRNNVSVLLERVLTDENGFVGSASLGIYDAEGKLAGFMENCAVEIDLSPNTHYNPFNVAGAVPLDLPDGIYTLKPVARLNDEDTFKPLIARVGAPYISYLNMQVEGNDVSLSEPEFVNADFKILSARPVQDRYFDGALNTVELVVRNDGAMYNGPIALSRIKEEDNVLIFLNNYIFEHGEQRTLRVKFNTPEGIERDELKMWIAVNDDDDYYGTGFDYGYVDSFTLDVTPKTPGAPVMHVDELEVYNPSAVMGDKVHVDVTVTNTGGFYGGPLYLYIFSMDTGYSVGGMSADVVVNGGETTHFSYEIPSSQLELGKYIVALYKDMERLGGAEDRFEVKDRPSIDVDNAEGYEVFCSESAFKVPAGMRCGVVTYVDVEKLTIDYRYRSDDVVPAHTPVVVSVDNAGKYPYESVKNNEMPPMDNLLSNAVDDEGYTYKGEGDYSYYGFKSDWFMENFGFYPYVLDAMPFRLKYQKCYLAVPKADAGPSYPFNKVTGIANLTTDNSWEKEGEVYHISGIRIIEEGDKLPSGVYIRNGKKILVR